METKAHGGAQQRHSQTTNTAINHPFITFSCFINHLLLLVPCALGITRSFSIFAPTVAAVLPSTTFSLSRDHLELVHSNNNRPDRASSIILEISSDCVVETLLERSVPLPYRKRNHSPRFQGTLCCDGATKVRFTNLLLQRRQPRKTPDESCVFLAVFVALSFTRIYSLLSYWYNRFTTAHHGSSALGFIYQKCLARNLGFLEQRILLRKSTADTLQ